MTSDLRLTAILAHPDDESMGFGPALVRYAAEGVQVSLICATRGQRGWHDQAGTHPGFEVVGRRREQELRQAAAVLGIADLTILDYLDGDLNQAGPHAASEIAGHLRRLRPQVVLTFALDGAYGHPDHIAISQLTSAAIVVAADAGQTVLAGQPSHRVAKLFHMVLTEERVRTIAQFVGGDIAMQVDGALRRPVAWPPWAVSTNIVALEHADTIWRAICCHQSQLATLGAMLDKPARTVAKAWATVSLLRVFSLVPPEPADATDLFAGLR